MKKIVLSIVLLTFISCINSGFANDTLRPKPKTDWEKDGLKGKVKLVHIDDAITKIGEPKRNSSNNTLIFYQGGTFYYNINGFLIESISNDTSKSISPIKYIYEYDKNYNLIIITELYSDGNKSYEKNYFDNYGKMLRKEKYNKEDKITYSYEYKYNELGYQISERVKINDYDFQFLYKYDTLGNNIEEVMIKNNIYQSKKEILYKDLKQKIEIKEYNYENKLISINENKYLLNNLVEEKRYDDSNNLTTTILYEYTFDSVGNWIKKQVYRNNELDYEQKREITYYDE